MTLYVPVLIKYKCWHFALTWHSKSKSKFELYILQVKDLLYGIILRTILVRFTTMIQEM